MERLILSWAAPTLVGRKVGSIFNYNYEGDDIDKIIKKWNKKLNPYDIFVEILREKVDTYLIYVFNKTDLSSLLKEKRVSKFLSSNGYGDITIEGSLSVLKNRLKSDNNSFPHEIGLFLGYPLSDVIGFIFYKGKSFKLCGQWKVYANVERCNKLFQEYRFYKSKFLELYHDGHDIIEIIKMYRGGIYEEDSSSILVRNR